MLTWNGWHVRIGVNQIHALRNTSCGTWLATTAPYSYVLSARSILLDSLGRKDVFIVASVTSWSRCCFRSATRWYSIQPAGVYNHVNCNCCQAWSTSARPYLYYGLSFFNPVFTALACIKGSAEALPILCVRYFRWERERDTERERERERRKWRHHCRAKIGDEFTLYLAKNSQLAMSSHFPLPKIRTSRFSLHTSRLSLHGEVTIVALKIAVSSHFPLPKFFSPSLFPLFQMARAARRVIENPRQMIKSYSSYFVFPIEKWIKLIPKLLEIEKEIVLRWLGVINLTWENLQIASTNQEGIRSV